MDYSGAIGWKDSGEYNTLRYPYSQSDLEIAPVGVPRVFYFEHLGDAYTIVKDRAGTVPPYLEELHSDWIAKTPAMRTPTPVVPKTGGGTIVGESVQQSGNFDRNMNEVVARIQGFRVDTEPNVKVFEPRIVESRPPSQGKKIATTPAQRGPTVSGMRF